MTKDVYYKIIDSSIIQKLLNLSNPRFVITYDKNNFSDYIIKYSIKNNKYEILLMHYDYFLASLEIQRNDLLDLEFSGKIRHMTEDEKALYLLKIK